MPTYLPELPNMLGTITAPRTQLVASVKPKELRYRMAVPLLTSVTLLIISAAGVHAVNSNLGEFCTATTHTCTHSSLELACDDVASQCRIQHGQSCGADTDLCVSGAECVAIGTNPMEHVCLCKAFVYTPDTATGKCTAPAGKWGGACADDSECGAGMFCSSNLQRCTCFADKRVNLKTGTCDRNLDAQAAAIKIPVYYGGASDGAASATAVMLAATLNLLILAEINTFSFM